MSADYMGECPKKDDFHGTRSTWKEYYDIYAEGDKFYVNISGRCDECDVYIHVKEVYDLQGISE